MKYLLYEYEEYLANGKTIQLPWNAIAKRPVEQTIEHILPQTPTDTYWTARFDKDTLRCFLHDLGNLCLTSDNSVYGNKPFPKKKGAPGMGNCYADSNLFQERELAASEGWTVESIKKRREKIVKWAISRWHVDDTGVTPETPDEAEEQLRRSVSHLDSVSFQQSSLHRICTRFVHDHIIGARCSATAESLHDLALRGGQIVVNHFCEREWRQAF